MRKNLKVHIDAFQEMLKNKIINKHYEFTLEELRKEKSKWNEWENESGIYYFVEEGSIVYIGRALKNTGLGSRVNDQIEAFGDPKWDRIIKNNQVIVGIVCVNEEMWFMTSSLELYLIDKIKPRINSRMQ
ncbi:MAG: hypothetical protein IID63_05560 [candidate division Zixibacteria bacterium]|nr:hypothetical protein [candidate division Zixibacteria bacterium]